jgi:hypothetical protein
MITEQNHGSQPHQVSLTLVPFTFLPEPASNIPNLTAAERVKVRARARGHDASGTSFRSGRFGFIASTSQPSKFRHGMSMSHSSGKWRQ